MDNATSGSGSTHDATLLTQEDTVSCLAKNMVICEFRDPRKQHIDMPAHLLKRKIGEEKQVTLKYNSNQNQFDFNSSVIQKLEGLKNS